MQWKFCCRKLFTEHRVDPWSLILTAIFDYAITKELCEDNPALGRSKLSRLGRLNTALTLQKNNCRNFLESCRNTCKPISEATLRKALRIMGYKDEKKVVPHGFRATASTILNESGLFEPDVIERQLAHVEENKVRAAYPAWTFR